LNIIDALVGIKALHVAESLLQSRFVLVVQLDIGLEAPEQVGRQREEAHRGKTVNEIAHRLVDPENFLDHDQAGAFAGGGRGEIAGEGPVRTIDGNGLSAHPARCC
jgi:hypothetical protein